VVTDETPRITRTLASCSQRDADFDQIKNTIHAMEARRLGLRNRTHAVVPRSSV
jgi:hypothetical protein